MTHSAQEIQAGAIQETRNENKYMQMQQRDVRATAEIAGKLPGHCEVSEGHILCLWNRTN